MTDTTPDQILARAQVPSANGRPIRKDEIELHDRGLYIESWLPERRSRRKPLLFVHGELAGSWLWERYLGYFASRGWEGHALNLQNHYWSRTADPTELTFETYVEDVVAGARPARADDRRRSATASAACSPSRPPSRRRSAASSCSRPEPPARSPRAGPAARAARRARRLRRGADRLGDAAREAPARPPRPDHRRRPPDPAPARPEAARERPGARAVLSGVPVDPRPFADVPRLVIGGGLDRTVPEPTSERLAEWLGAEYEPFGAHSHYGLVVGEQSHQQVADAIRGFLEAHRL